MSNNIIQKNWKWIEQRQDFIVFWCGRSWLLFDVILLQINLIQLSNFSKVETRLYVIPCRQIGIFEIGVAYASRVCFPLFLPHYISGILFLHLFSISRFFPRLWHIFIFLHSNQNNRIMFSLAGLFIEEFSLKVFEKATFKLDFLS